MDHDDALIQIKAALRRLLQKVCSKPPAFRSASRERNPSGGRRNKALEPTVRRAGGQSTSGPDHGHLGLLHRLRGGGAVRAGRTRLPAIDGLVAAAGGASGRRTATHWFLVAHSVRR